MGKSSKKSTPKADVVPAVTPVIKSGKKGKREAEVAIDKVAIEKKQKIDAATEQAVLKAKKETKTKTKTVKKKVEKSSSEDDSSSESEEEQKVTTKKATVATAKNGATAAKKVESSDSSDEGSESNSDDEKPTKDASKTKEVPAAKNGSVVSKKAESSESSDEGSDSGSDSDDDKTTTKKPTTTAAAKKAESSDSSDSDSDEPAAAVATKKTTPAVAKKESDDSSDEESEEDEPSKTPKKKDADVDMVDANSKSAKKEPKTPVTAQAPTGGSKTLFVGNLSYEVEQADVEKFFKGAGEIIGIRFSSDPEGNFKGFGHVEFATAEAAQKAMELNGENLCDRPVRLDLARERGTFTPNNGKDGGSFQKHTAFCKGFDTSLGEDEIRSSLEKHFGSCGEITRMSIPKDYDSGNSKGMAYIDFTSVDSFNKALELNGSELDGYSLVVDEAKPRDGASGGRGGGRSGGRGGRGGGGRSFGRDGGGGGRSFGRDGGGRGGRGGGRSFGRDGGGRGGRGGRGSPYARPSGRKTTFDD